MIKCRVDNVKSNRWRCAMAFQLEGCMQQAEFLNGDYYDVNLYARIIDDSSE